MYRKAAAALVPVWVAVTVGVLGAPAVALASDPPVVTFYGAGSLLGLPLLTCASQPDHTAVSLAAGSGLRLDNQTGYPAVVYLNGTASTTHVATGDTATVTLAPGAWTVTLLPDCLLNLSSAGSVAVTVAAPESQRPLPGPSTHRPSPTPPAASLPAAPAPAASSPSPAPARSAVQRSRQPVAAGPPAGRGSGTPSAGAVFAGGTYPAAYRDPTADKAPNYLLTIVAAAGVVGVGAAAVNALRLRRRAGSRDDRGVAHPL